jgi:phosphoglycolate phosphatase
MIDIEVLIFDLDGTLVDSKGVIINGLNFTLRKLGKSSKTYEQISPHLGVDSSYLISKIIDTDDPKIVKKGLKYFKNYWDSNIATQSSLFDGVIETLEYFKDKKMLVLSNGIFEVIDTMLESFELKKYFSGIFTGDESDCVKPSPCPIDKAFEKGYLNDRSKTLMIGDMDIDITAGKKAKVLTCAVTYGMGKLSDIKKSSPDFIISRITDLKKIIKK